MQIPQTTKALCQVKYARPKAKYSMIAFTNHSQDKTSVIEMEGRGDLE